MSNDSVNEPLQYVMRFSNLLNWYLLRTYFFAHFQPKWRKTFAFCMAALSMGKTARSLQDVLTLTDSWWEEHLWNPNSPTLSRQKINSTYLPVSAHAVCTYNQAADQLCCKKMHIQNTLLYKYVMLWLPLRYVFLGLTIRSTYVLRKYIDFSILLL